MFSTPRFTGSSSSHTYFDEYQLYQLILNDNDIDEVRIVNEKRYRHRDKECVWATSGQREGRATAGVISRR